jgi:hypothetical protein
LVIIKDRTYHSCFYTVSSGLSPVQGSPIVSALMAAGWAASFDAAVAALGTETPSVSKVLR